MPEKNVNKAPRFIHLTETTSTNVFLQHISQQENLASGSIVLADFQTSGRGQMGNAWESEAGKNLTFSLLFHPTDLMANRAFAISEITALSIKYTLDNYLPEVSIKWPNDLYYKRCKIAGMLIENALLDGKVDRSIIGIGLNVNQQTFHSDAPNPISIASITGKTLDRMEILDSFRNIFAEQSDRIDTKSFDAIHKDYLEAIYQKNGYHQYADSNGIFEARIYDVEPSGHLILERANGLRSRYAFKEVSYIP